MLSGCSVQQSMGADEIDDGVEVPTQANCNGRYEPSDNLTVWDDDVVRRAMGRSKESHRCKTCHGLREATVEMAPPTARRPRAFMISQVCSADLLSGIVKVRVSNSASRKKAVVVTMAFMGPGTCNFSCLPSITVQ